METIKVKRSPQSKGRCKLAWNKVYTAYKYDNTSKYELGKQFYPASWFTIVTDNQPKSKPVVTTDPKTGKLKVDRDWSKPQAFPEWYKVPMGTECITLKEDIWWDFITPKNTKVRVLGDSGEANETPFLERLDGIHRENCIDKNENGFCDSCLESKDLAPLNPTEHPEHPEFGKANRVVHTKNSEVTTVDTTGTEQAPEPYKELPIPKPKHDIRDTIAEYVRKYGHELTAIELIGHLTIDKQ